MNDYEAHLSSYDHSHKQRLKDMKAMVRDPNAGARARRAEAKADGIVSITMGSNGDAGATATNAATMAASTGGGGFKKGGFKKSGFKSAFAPADGQDQSSDAAANAKTGALATGPSRVSKQAVLKDSLVESDTEDEGYEVYDPRFPTD